jgi:opacity protein-like surface antigen
VGFWSCDDKTWFNGSALDSEGGATYGGKFGYFSTNLTWLGFEFNYFERDAEVEQQTFTATGSSATTLVPSLPFDGQAAIEFSNVKTFGLLVLLRPTESMIQEFLFGKLEPWVGGGFSGNWAVIGPISTFTAGGTPIATSGSSESDFALGYIISAGLNFNITRQWKIYSEYKYSSAFFRLEDADTYDTELDYSDHSLMFGVSYWFDSRN